MVAADFPEVGKAEAFRRLETVTQGTVKSDVCAPDEADSQKGQTRCAGDVGDESRGQNDSGGEMVVAQIVKRRSEAWAGQITEHGQIRGKKENREPETIQVEMPVEQAGDDEGRQTFEPKPGTGE